MAILANHELHHPGNHRAGFTLLELLVALSVFVVLSVMAYQSLSNLLRTRDIIEEKARDLDELQMFFMILGNDLSQAVARTVVMEDGKRDAAFRGGEQTSTWLTLTRSGRSNPRGEARSEFQRIAWMFEGGALIRRSWRHLDALGENPHDDETMVQQVLHLEVSFTDDKGGKFPLWPKEEDTTVISDTLPRAVEVTLEKQGIGRIRRIFELPLAPGWL
ncbi:MAG: type II secretion system minor pseudopilin GspJ [Magnetococcales bacterium]|nr:type II secretion system minor pseudopilin GspJ [Magnetococcales bacterium]